MDYYGQYKETLIEEVMNLLYDRAYEGLFFLHDPSDLNDKDHYRGHIEIMRAVANHINNRLAYYRELEREAEKDK